MNFEEMLAPLQAGLGTMLPKLAAALAILVVGWLLALLVRAGIRKGLGLLRVNERLAEGTGSTLDLASGLATGAFYLIMLLVLVAFFGALDLQMVSGPLEGIVTTITGYLPQVLAAGVMLLVAWLIATVIRMVTTKALAATTLDDKVSAAAGATPISDSLGNILYWLVFLIFLPAILGTLELNGLLDPVQGMVDKILAMLPNIFAAGVIGLVGWFVARILRDLVGNLLSAVGADAAGARLGLSGTLPASRLAGLVVFVLVFVPVLISALNALQIEAISGPATQMLATVLDALPNIFAAAIILGVAFLLSRFVGGLAAKLLGGLGFDNLPARLGLGAAFSEGAKPSELVGKIVVFFIMLFATVEAAGMVGFTQVSGLVGTFIAFGSQVLLGVAILAIGVWLANLAHGAMLRLSGDQATGMAGLARAAILGLVAAMGLRAMGIADDIVNIAFTLVLGAIAVSIALSFGLGGREAAGRQMEHWLAKLRNEEKS